MFNLLVENYDWLVISGGIFFLGVAIGKWIEVKFKHLFKDW